ncbi:MAG: protein kinase [Planctomycetota bacterium JB042]
MRRSEDPPPPPDGPSPDDVDRALARLWSGDGSSLDRLLPAREDDVPVDRLARGLLLSNDPAAREDRDERPAEIRVDGYTIIHPLGRGGMGDVFFAEQHQPRRSVALKVARQGREETRDRLMVHEAEMLARLQHPGIATIYDVGETDDGRRTIAMELVEGTRLDRWLAAEERPLHRKLELFRGICAAVHYAHLQGVVHRDLKPTNILVDRGGDPKVLDFGLAQHRAAEGPLAAAREGAGRRIGTLPYMSPEQVTGRYDDVGARSDLYSIGVMLYQAVTGRLPYPIHADRPAEAVRSICELLPTPPRAIDRNVPPIVEEIVLRALRKDPSERYGSAAEMQEDLARAGATVAASGDGASVLTRPATWSPPYLASVLLAFVALGLGLGAAITEFQIDRRMRSRAAAAAEEDDGTFGTGRFLSESIADLGPDDIDAERPVESLLDYLAGRLEPATGLSPRSRMKLHTILARRYRALDRLDSAARHYDRTWEMRRDDFGPADSRTLNARVALASLLFQLGRLDEAEPHARQALFEAERAGVEPVVPRARRVLANIAEALGHEHEAASLRAALDAPSDLDADATD